MVKTIVLVGRVGREPEMRNMADGTPVVGFSVAVTKKKKRGEEFTEDTTWFNVSQFGKRAEWLMEKNPKGCLVFVSGEPAVNEYTTKDGTNVREYKVIAQEVKIISRPKDQQQTTQVAGPGFDSDDVPF